MCRFKESDEPEIAKMQYEEQIKNLRGHLKWQIFIAIAATWLYYPPLKLVLWIKDQVQKAAGNASGKDDELL
ncbi:MAG: hypothetical protein J6Y90_02315, partial [Lachnospiraceae bacterium]|nr:hypothetical protein [Lachnospiraceae bacterium]